MGVRTVDLQATPMTVQELLALARAEDAEIILTEGSKRVGRLLLPDSEADKQTRIHDFEVAARELGEAITATGLSEEDLMARFEEARWEVFEEHYGKHPSE